MKKAVPSKENGSRSKPVKAAPTLYLKTKYQNDLPEPPFDCKFVSCPFVDLSRFAEYKQTTLETKWNHELLTEPNLGVHVDLIDPDTYRIHDALEQPELHPIDAELLDDETVNTADMRRSQRHQKVVPWMRKTEYISADVNRFGVNADRQETKVGYNISKRKVGEQNVPGGEATMPHDVYRSIEEQIGAIEKTFADAQKPVLSHPHKKSVVPIEELPVYPDFDLWRYPFAQVTFDTDPTPANTPAPSAQLKMASALIRGMKDDTGEQFVAYFVPTDDCLSKRLLHDALTTSAKTTAAGDELAQSTSNKEGGEESDDKATTAPPAVDIADDEPEDYLLLRNYNWTVKNKESAGYEQAYFFVLRNGHAYYNELETRVKLFRRRVGGVPQPTGRSRMILRRRPEEEDEIAYRTGRLIALKHPREIEELQAAAEREQQHGSDDDDERQATKQANVAKSASNSDDSDEDARKKMTASTADNAGAEADKAASDNESKSDDDDSESD